MQYILTQQEYNDLCNKANVNSTILLNDFYKEQYHILQKQLIKQQEPYKELNNKYTKLLVFGVSTNNKKLKGH